MKNKYCKRCGIQIFWNNNECGECIVIGVRNDDSDFSSVFKKSLPFLFDPKPDKEKINYSKNEFKHTVSEIIIFGDMNKKANIYFYRYDNPLPGKPL